MLTLPFLGYQEPGSRAQGCVFIIKAFETFKAGDVIDVSNMDKICSREDIDYGRFGHAITTWDWNQDGFLDVYVGSPTAGTETALYMGNIETFDGSKEGLKRHAEQVNVERPDLYTQTNGWSLEASSEVGLLSSGRHVTIDWDELGIHTKQSGILDIETRDQNNFRYFGDQDYSWTGSAIQPLHDGLVAFSSPVQKINGVNTVGQVQILKDLRGPSSNDTWINPIETVISNPGGHSDQFGTALTMANLTFEGQMRSCLIIGAPTASYGIHTNAGAVYIYDAVTFELLGYLEGDRALARLGRSFGSSKDLVWLGAPRYHEVI
jgi:hypothetical protein